MRAMAALAAIILAAIGLGVFDPRIDARSLETYRASYQRVTAPMSANEKTSFGGWLMLVGIQYVSRNAQDRDDFKVTPLQDPLALTASELARVKPAIHGKPAKEIMLRALLGIPRLATDAQAVSMREARKWEPFANCQRVREDDCEDLLAEMREANR